MATSAGAISLDLVVNSERAIKNIARKANELDRAISSASSKSAKTLFDNTSSSITKSLDKAFSSFGKELNKSFSDANKGAKAAQSQVDKLSEALSFAKDSYADQTAGLFDSFAKSDEYSNNFKKAREEAEKLKEAIKGMSGKELESANERLKQLRTRQTAAVELMEEEGRKQDALIKKRDATAEKINEIQAKLASAKTEQRAARLQSALSSVGGTIAFVAKAAATATVAISGFAYGFIAADAAAQKPIAAYERFNNITATLRQRMTELSVVLRSAATTAFLGFAESVQSTLARAAEAARNFAFFIGKAAQALTGRNFGEILAQNINREKELAIEAANASDSTGKLSKKQQQAAKAAALQDKAQKELNRTLAGFDKINRLQSDEDLGIGGSTIEEPEVIVNPPELAAWERFGEEANRILASIKLPPSLEASLGRVRDAFGSLTDTIRDGLGKAYDQILKPLADWAWEVVVPQGLDLIADALGHIEDFLGSIEDPMMRLLGLISDLAKWLWTDLLQPVSDWAVNSLFPQVLEAIGTTFDIIVTVLEKLKPVAKFLWDEILAPVGKFLGDVFVGALDLVNDGLKWLLDLISQADFSEFIENLRTIKNWIGDRLLEAFDALGKAADWVYKNVLKPIGDFFGGIFSGDVDIVKMALDGLKGVFDGLKSVGDWVYNNVFKPIGDFFAGAFKKGAEVAKGALDGLKGVFDGIKSVGDWVYNHVFKPIGDFFAGVFGDNVKSATGVLDTFKGLWDGIKDKTATLTAKAKDALGKAGEAISNFWGNVKDKASELTAKAKDALGTAGTNIKNFWNNVKDKAAELTAKAKDALGNAGTNIKNFWNGIKDKAAELTGKAKNALGTAGSAIKNFWDGIVNKNSTLSGYAKNMLGQTGSAIKDFWTGIITGDRTLTGKAANKLGAIGDNLKDFWKKIVSDDRTLVGKAANKLGSVGDKIKEFWGDVKDKTSTLTAKAKDLLGKVGEKIAEFFGIEDKTVTLSAKDNTTSGVNSAKKNIGSVPSDKRTEFLGLNRVYEAIQGKRGAYAWIDSVADNKVTQFLGKNRVYEAIQGGRGAYAWIDSVADSKTTTFNGANKLPSTVDGKAGVKAWIGSVSTSHATKFIGINGLTDLIDNTKTGVKAWIRSVPGSKTTAFYGSNGMQDTIDNRSYGVKAWIRSVPGDKWTSFYASNQMQNDIDNRSYGIKAWIGSVPGDKWTNFYASNQMQGDIDNRSYGIKAWINSVPGSRTTSFYAENDTIPDIRNVKEWINWLPSSVTIPITATLDIVRGSFNNAMSVIENGLSMFGINAYLPRFAQGGYVGRNTPMLAVIGDNTREGEVVAPESKLQDMANKAAAGGDMTQVVNLLTQLLEAVNSVDMNTYLDGQAITRAVVQNVNRQTQVTGRSPILV